MAAEDFDSVEANAGTGGALFAMDTFLDASGDTRVMPFSAIVIPDGTGYSRVTSVNPLPVSGAVTNAGVFAVQEDGAALTALQLISSAINAEDTPSANLDKGIVLLARRSDTTPSNTSSTNGDYESLTVKGGKLWCVLADSVDVINQGVFAVQVDAALPAGDNNIGNVDIVTVPTDPFGVDADAASATGSISAKLRFIASTGIPITGTVTVASHNVTNAGTFVVQIDGTALTKLTDIETNTDSCAVVGNGAAATAQRVTLANDSTGVLATLTTLTGGATAHDAADAGNPHKIGAKATTSLSGKTMVADNDRSDLFCGTDGVQITRPHTNLEDIVSGNANNTDGTSTQCIAAQAAGIKTYLTSIILTNTSSSNIYVEIKDGATAKLTIPLPANGGAIFNPPVPLPGTAATAWNFDPSAATTTVYCSMIGFKSKV